MMENLTENEKGWALPIEIIEYIKRKMPGVRNILELGSGNGTKVLLKHWSVISIEHDPEWVVCHPPKNGKHHIMIHAPIKEVMLGTDRVRWYDIERIQDGLDAQPFVYDLIIVDGPTGDIGRMPFNKLYGEVFEKVTVIFDDCHAEKYDKQAQELRKKHDMFLKKYEAPSKDSKFIILTPRNMNEKTD